MENIRAEVRQGPPWPIEKKIDLLEEFSALRESTIRWKTSDKIQHIYAKFKTWKEQIPGVTRGPQAILSMGNFLFYKKRVVEVHNGRSDQLEFRQNVKNKDTTQASIGIFIYRLRRDNPMNSIISISEEVRTKFFGPTKALKQCEQYCRDWYFYFEVAEQGGFSIFKECLQKEEVSADTESEVEEESQPVRRKNTDESEDVYAKRNRTYTPHNGLQSTVKQDLVEEEADPTNRQFRINPVGTEPVWDRVKFAIECVAWFHATGYAPRLQDTQPQEFTWKT